MEDDMKEMVWESEWSGKMNTKYEAQFKHPAQDSFCTNSYEFTPVSQRPFERPVVKALHKPIFHSALDPAKSERRMMSLNKISTLPTDFDFVKPKQNGNGPSVTPAQLTFPQQQRPVKPAQVETKKIGCSLWTDVRNMVPPWQAPRSHHEQWGSSGGPAQMAIKPAEASSGTRDRSESSNSVFGKPNHTLASAFAKSFPIKNSVSSSQWSTASRRSPKKLQRQLLSTVEETVREDEKELYRQLLQAVTGRSFFASKSTTFLSPQISRSRLSSSSVSGPLVTSSISSLEPSTLEVDPPCPPQFNLDSSLETSKHLLGDATNFKPTCENGDVTNHQLNRQHSQSSQEQLNRQHSQSSQEQLNKQHSQPSQEGSDSIIIVDSTSRDANDDSSLYFRTELWIKDLTSSYDSRKREKWRKIDEQKAVATHLQNERLNERPKTDSINLNLRVPLEKEIPIALPPKLEDDSEGQEFPDLTQDMEKEIKRALFGGSPDQVISEGFRLTITRKDIMTLDRLNWLNDEIINFYMNLLMERSKRKGLPKVHAFNTFFFPKLKSAGYQAVKRWTKKVDVLAADILLVPVHLGVHWCLAVVDFRKKTITYYDSMGGQNNEACKVLLQYLKQESQDKKGVCFDTNGWSLSSKRSQEIPQQMNGSDCGMFACKYADYITKDKSITFTQHHMPYFRKRMVWEILHQKLL